MIGEARIGLDGLVMSVDFRVDGTPRGKGSFQLVRNKHTGKTFPKIDTPEAAGWARAVAEVARYSMRGLQPFDDAVAVLLHFRIERPKTHWTDVGGIPSKAWRDYPDRHGHGRYDVDKMERLVLDSLKDGGVLADDSRVVDVVKRTRYAIKGTEQPGVDVSVRRMPPLEERQERPKGGVVIRRAPEERGTRG